MANKVRFIDFKQTSISKDFDNPINWRNFIRKFDEGQIFHAGVRKI
jgi:hypothetical protein